MSQKPIRVPLAGRASSGRQEPEAPARLCSELLDAWRAAREEANERYRDWRRVSGTDSYVVYRAAEDRADAATAELVSRCA